jgi:hypothetical protein
VEYEQLNSLISYGDENHLSVQIPSTDFFTRQEPFPAHRQVMWDNILVPVFFFQENIEKLWSKQDSNAKFHFDIIGNIFFFLSGWQEYYSKERDKYGRFPFKASLQYKLNMAHVPVVNYYFDMLRNACEYVLGKEITFREKYRQPSVMLSHDIDKINTGWLEEGNALLKEKNIFSFIQLIFNRMLHKDPWNNLSDILQLEKQMQVKSVFYILPRKGKYRQVKNADYSLKAIKPQIRQIESMGWTVGLHASFGTSDNEKEYHKDYNCLKDLKHNRFHFLSWSPEKSPGILEKYHILTDSTLGFAETPGFRNAIAHPFPIFDLKNFKITSVWEIPLNIMDTTFVQYQKIPAEELPLVIQPVLSEAEKFNGCITVLWHNNFFNSVKYKNWDAAYINLVQYFKQKKYRFILPDEVFSF